ncbi:hypothetical protein CAI21_16705 [Alkalilimnicola ehrlichii]|uniref:CBM21 domain-containing protein n=1 Tax=Alkalilimnicola ehrlichii TaxID=351052 RepID=A0A3E0WHF5_9GAMM|nr:carbohydrate-binding protein [Alkalilimnicola ehrlichii]RFA26601.1 hypothetical protein CAI21_16705 [Alkalilimnicola ehrlichii]RFA31879.1 hypothetical protein CAL65_21135 [Alkalilimnicola ehrlichii]
MTKLFSRVLLALVLFAFAGTSLAADEVSMLRAQSIVSSKYGMSAQNAVFDVLVKDLASDKTVTIVIGTEDDNWLELPATYKHSTEDGREFWRARYSGDSWWGQGPISDLTWAVKYEVDGQVYWDNNNGQNYFIAANSGSQLFGVNLANATHTAQVNLSQGQNLHGRVTLNNLGPDKQVQVVYSTDGWATTQTADARFGGPWFWFSSYSSASNPNPYGFEEWVYELKLDGATTVEYAISYTVNDQTYWDNNFGRNYVETINYFSP